ncbi:class I SAM-dependent DNA methyltransferase [Conexibacter woesei]|uniref:Methyltransferase type 11 n=1 Tax=Conexibacter woesei (strain DSM 14684 / CCUG 47730 / CIP 108061 / JCM 11494 / NBRC 100937 / ID131577) TaxID=469383 RepID=D3F1B0_CONWI|nr:class I SAM-dependent methyltransferase [Conexibacter woesei]ADB52073.1 Methyltransferase type 11 [Conexibacter woesei DSM 14684]
MRTTSTPPAALVAYERLAAVYDRFTDSYDHDGWVGRLERLAREHGLRGRRALDVACGTGKSFAPLVRRGYDVWACDLSPAMVDQARRSKALPADRIEIADMRQLSYTGTFSLVSCLDDAVNYLLDEDDLAAAFASVARVLAPDGVYVFDANSLSTYREGFSTRATFERPLADAIWRGETTGPIVPGSLCAASIELGGGGAAVSRHVQRHHPEPTIRHALASAGLACRAVLGQSTGGVLHEDADEETHTKLVYVAGRAA